MYRLSGLIALLALVAAAGGLFVPGLYRENGYMLPQAQGNDLVTIAFALPLFVGSAMFAARGSLRGQVIWLGVLGYLLYTYITLALDAVFNPFFLLYVGILAIAAFFVVAVRLWRRQPMGYVLTAMLLVMTTLIDLVGVPLSLVMGTPGPAAIMGMLAGAGLGVTLWFFRRFDRGLRPVE